MERWNFREGAEVRSADDEKLGKVVAVEGDYLVVEKGFFFPTDYYIPSSAIASADDDTVYLSVRKDEALTRGWDQRMTTGAEDTAVTGTVGTAWNAANTTDVRTDDALRVPVYEEDLTATKRPVDRGAVRIEKELVTEDRTITVPVTEEQVRVTRVDAADATSPVSTADAFREGVIEVPVTGEEVDVQKTARLAGEVVVEKEAVQQEKQVGGTVRREEVHVDDATEPTTRDPRA